MTMLFGRKLNRCLFRSRRPPNFSRPPWPTRLLRFPSRSGISHGSSSFSWRNARCRWLWSFQPQRSSSRSSRILIEQSPNWLPATQDISTGSALPQCVSNSGTRFACGLIEAIERKRSRVCVLFRAAARPWLLSSRVSRYQWRRPWHQRSR